MVCTTQQKLRLIRTGNICPIFCWNITEITLLWVLNDLVLAGLLPSCFWTTAFGTVDCSIFLTRLELRAGIKDTTTGSSHIYQIGVFSPFRAVFIIRVTTCGGPQGSLLGPILLSFYMLPFRSIFKKRQHLLSLLCSWPQDRVACTNQQPYFIQALVNYLRDVQSWVDINLTE